MNARLYDPLLGQFISVDPLADKYPGLSAYVYCANNPLRYIDPTGMSFWSYIGDWFSSVIDDVQDIISQIEEVIAEVIAGLDDLLEDVFDDLWDTSEWGLSGTFDFEKQNAYKSWEVSARKIKKPNMNPGIDVAFEQAQVTQEVLSTRVESGNTQGGVKVDWISQYNSKVPNHGSKACKRACYMMNPAAQKGMNNGFFVGREDGKSFITTNQTSQGYQYLNKQLSIGRPVIAGVGRNLTGYWGNNANGDFTTDHFVVIDNSIDGGYHFLDPGTKYPASGTNANNIFRLMPNGLYTGTSYGAPMTITWIGLNR